MCPVGENVYEKERRCSLEDSCWGTNATRGREASSPRMVSSTAHQSLTDAPLPAGRAPYPDVGVGSSPQPRKVPQHLESAAL